MYEYQIFVKWTRYIKQFVCYPMFYFVPPVLALGLMVHAFR